MDKEIEVAVEWWTDKIAGGAKQDNGDAMTVALMLLLTRNQRPPTAPQVETFKTALSEALRENLQKNWDVERPTFGGAFRSIYNDYGVDPVLRVAAEKAGIDAQCPPFPMKTCMWINPGRVSVRYGYGASEETLYDAMNAIPSTRGVK